MFSPSSSPRNSQLKIKSMYAPNLQEKNQSAFLKTIIAASELHLDGPLKHKSNRFTDNYSPVETNYTSKKKSTSTLK
jgi:hypothetical protein